MSNIYYKQKNINNDGIFNFQSNSITVENITKVLNHINCGLGLVDTTIPFPSSRWRKDELYYQHADYGLVYIPKNICLTDGIKNYFIVLIDTEIEIRYWPACNLATSNIDEKINHVAVTLDAFNKVEASFDALIDYLGINKSIEEQYAKVKGVKLNRTHLVALVDAFLPKYNQTVLIDRLFAAAVKPVLFFKDNRDYLEGLEIDEPSKYMYVFIFLYELENLGRIYILDWKASAADINHAIAVLSNGEIKNVVNEIGATKSTDKLFKLASIHLQQKGKVLLQVYTDTDSYSIVLLEESKVPEMIDKAKECKIKMFRF